MPADPDVPWDTVSKIRRSDRKKQIVNRLDKDPASATDLADEMEIQRNTISNHIRELKKMDPQIVRCITPEQPHHRLYDLTEEGAKVYQFI